MGGGGAGVGWGRSGRVVLIDNGRVYQSKAVDALVQVKTTTFGTNVGLNMLLNISSRYFGGLFWSRQLRVCHPQMAIFLFVFWSTILRNKTDFFLIILDQNTYNHSLSSLKILCSVIH